MGKPDSWIALQVRTDGFRTRQVDLPGEAPSVPREGTGKQGTSGNTRLSEALGVADEPVVVRNPKPMNTACRTQKLLGKSAGNCDQFYEYIQWSNNISRMRKETRREMV